MNATWQGKITVTATYIPPVSMKNVMKKMEFNVYENVNEDISSSGFVKPGASSSIMISGTNKTYPSNTLSVSGFSIKKIVFQDTINPYTDAFDVVDFSAEGDNSVLGYYVRNGDSKDITLYIQADGKIKVNPIASGYFCDNGGSYTFEGLESLDTSMVTDMSYMFFNYSQDNLNLDFLDTSKVESMAGFFFECKNLVNLDLSSFDTSKLTDISSICSGCVALTNLNMFSISNVTNMKYAFYNCKLISTAIKITNKNLEYYNHVTDGSAIAPNALITIDYTTETEEIVNQIIKNNNSNSNIVKGSLITN